MSNTRVVSIFIPHEGCPHDCIFCNQKKISGKTSPPSILEVREIIDKAISTIDSYKYKIILAFYGGSFTAIDFSLQGSYLLIAQEYKSKGLVDEIRLSTRPDYLKKEHIQFLYDYNVDHIEIGVQSTDELVLNLCKRYYDLDTIKNAVETINRYNIKYGFQIMLGLPEDNIIKTIRTTYELSRLNPSTLRIYPTLVIKDTELEESYYRDEYTPLAIEEAIEYALIPYIYFSQRDCQILRIGLHPTESLLYEGNVVAGPFHSSFGELVKSRLYWHMIKYCLDKNNINNKVITIIASPREFSKIVGNKGENKNKLLKHYNIILKLQEGDIGNNEIIINYDNEKIKLSLKEYCEKSIDKYTKMLNRS